MNSARFKEFDTFTETIAVRFDDDPSESNTCTLHMMRLLKVAGPAGRMDVAYGDSD